MSWRIYEHVSKKRKLYWTVEDRSGCTRYPAGPNGGQALFFKREHAEAELSRIRAMEKPSSAIAQAEGRS